jgi:uncharacterized protein YbbK (DUF523 family)
LPKYQTVCCKINHERSTRPISPAEIIQGRVVTNLGEDVTEQFQTGANIALELCKKNQVRFALLKESSPSCGRNTIYDGKHRGVKIEGLGLTAALLIKNGIQADIDQTNFKNFDLI